MFAICKMLSPCLVPLSPSVSKANYMLCCYMNIVIVTTQYEFVIPEQHMKGKNQKEITEGKKGYGNIKLLSILSVIFSIIPSSANCIILKSIVFVFIKSKMTKKKRKIFINLDAVNASSNSSVKSDSCALVFNNG